MAKKNNMTSKLQDRPGKSKFTTAFGLLKNYGIDRLLGKPSTAGFWWLKEFARVRDRAAFEAYLASANPSPLYLMDYHNKLSFTHRNGEGIMVLPYALPTGDQINPEAAFIYALALHDDFCSYAKQDRKDEFLRYANYFCQAQTENGDWPYLFDWPGSSAPWTSALAQGRGASVMVRAFLLSREARFDKAARQAISRFDTPIEKGGYQAIHPLTGHPYYEEYPGRPIGVMNGFMASLLGCWEVAHWLEDKKASKLFDQGITSLVEMSPHYLTQWWSVYDRNPDIKSPNYNTPRYHRLVLSYFEILAVLSGNSQISAQRDQWRQCLGPINETRAMALKFAWKLKYGVFSS